MTKAGLQAVLGSDKLRFAVNDAKALANDMKRAAEGLYAETRATLVLNQGATRGSFAQAMDKVAAKVHPRDTLILFIAGHGVTADGRFYFIPQDYQSGPNSLRRSAIGQEALEDWFANKIVAQKAIIILDTCESGAVVSRAGLSG